MTINCKGELITFDIPKVMGIVNVTDNSFYSNSRVSISGAVERAGQMLADGATFIDVGGYSTRPDASFVSEEDELKKAVEAVKLLVKEYPKIIISVDTFRAKVARACLDAGAAIINDISAGHLDKNMWDVVEKYQVPYLVMHMRGNPQNMTTLTNYDNFIADVIKYFSDVVATARERGINDLIIDPGFGFAKTLDQNYELLQQTHIFKKYFDYPLLVGISRKSMLYKFLGGTPQDSLNGTTVLNTISLMKGADILRVHDVKEAMETVKIFVKMNEYTPIEI